jgi:acetylornithine deacetylase/succinyl-diaminopimelate desuccinylase-like protein
VYAGFRRRTATQPSTSPSCPLLVVVLTCCLPRPRFGPTRFSVIPKTAVAKVSVRFVPRQDPHHIITRLRDHIHTEFAKLGRWGV